jgi:hypothetical protein
VPLAPPPADRLLVFCCFGSSDSRYSNVEADDEGRAAAATGTGAGAGTGAGSGFIAVTPFFFFSPAASSLAPPRTSAGSSSSSRRGARGPWCCLLLWILARARGGTTTIPAAALLALAEAVEAEGCFKAGLSFLSAANCCGIAGRSTAAAELAFTGCWAGICC